jgi:hypothetical protein
MILARVSSILKNSGTAISATETSPFHRLRRLITGVPGARAIYRKVLQQGFAGTQLYWEERYRMGGNSGSGSYGRLALFKAEVLNAFVAEHGVTSVIELGCGDGNQLSLARYPTYIGLDISRTAIASCAARFAGDSSKSFFLYSPPWFVDNRGLFRAELALSLDVIYHLMEDDIYHRYMSDLFKAGTRYVIVYSSNVEGRETISHFRSRRFTDWVSANATEWKLLAKIANKFPYDPRQPDDTSLADFYLFERYAPSS